MRSKEKNTRVMNHLYQGIHQIKRARKNRCHQGDYQNLPNSQIERELYEYIQKFKIYQKDMNFV